MNTRQALGIITAAAILIGAARGDDNSTPKQPAPPSLPPRLVQLLQGSADNFIQRLDRNNDGVLTKDELPPRLARFFDNADANSDGKLDRGEVERLLPVLRKRFGVGPAEAPKKGPTPAEVDRVLADLLKRMDADNDGRISRAEAKAGLAKNFDHIDTNKDGYLDKDELRRMIRRYLANRKANAAAVPAKPAAAAPDFDALDRNADGRLTREELQGTPYADHFDEIDTNKDGKIDPKEFAAYLQKQAAAKAARFAKPDRP